MRAIDGDLGVKYPSNITYSLTQLTDGESAEQPVLNITTVNGTGIVSVARSFSVENFTSSDGYIAVNLTVSFSSILSIVPIFSILFTVVYIL